jgi:hypothetical protein
MLGVRSGAGRSCHAGVHLHPEPSLVLYQVGEEGRQVLWNGTVDINLLSFNSRGCRRTIHPYRIAQVARYLQVIFQYVWNCCKCLMSPTATLGAVVLAALPAGLEV